MDFTERGLIKIEECDGALLGHAVALGENSLEDFGRAEVDTSPRDLNFEETVAAIHGLYRMVDIYTMQPSTVTGLIQRHNVGANGVLAFRRYGDSAAHYLKQIALHGVQESQAVS